MGGLAAGNIDTQTLKGRHTCLELNRPRQPKQQSRACVRSRLPGTATRKTHAEVPERPVVENELPAPCEQVDENSEFSINLGQLQDLGAPVTDDPEADGQQIATWWLKARRMREDMFGPGLFADPAWDILLDLYTADARGECVQTSSLAFAARVPHSTAIRWAKIMTSAGLIDRHADPQDARRVHVRLSTSARALMDEYMVRLCQSGQVPRPILA
jgi:DNA-binding MarR family transcriptional regulator